MSAAITVVLMVSIMIAFNGTIKALVTKTIALPSQGTVKAIGVGVYWDNNGSNRVSLIDWGVMEPGQGRNVTVYIRNEGNIVMTLSMNTTNWNPSTASNYIGLSWNYNGQAIDPGVVIQVALTLSVSSNITGISSFSFDILITGSG